MNEETGIREKDGETLNLTFIYDTAQDSLVSSYATLLKSQLEKVGIGLELKGSEKMEWYAEMMAGNFDITYWIGEYEFSSPHCFFGAMPSMTPHTFSLSQVDGSQEFLTLSLLLSRRTILLRFRNSTITSSTMTWVM